MNALDRLRRSTSRLPGRVGELVQLNGEDVRGFFRELDGDDTALGFVNGQPRRTATLEIAVTDLAGRPVSVGAGVVVQGEAWEVTPPVLRRTDGFVFCHLELADG